MVKTIQLESREIGEGARCFIIAEAGVNHNGDLGVARELVKQAKSAGADCIKFQTFSAERVVTPTAPKAAYQLQVTDPAESQFDMLKKLELSAPAHRELIALSRELGIVFLSTPYSIEDAEMLAELGVGGFKIASGQLVEIPFLRALARLGRPLIVSTGMGTMAEIAAAVECIQGAGNPQIVLLQCTTNYPSPAEEANLRAMDTLRAAFHVPVGYSDHTEGITVCLGAAARGACVIEKHFTLNRASPGPDHSSSCEPDMLASMVAGVREIESALGDPVKAPTRREARNIPGMRRSIVAKRDIQRGSVITEADLAFKRPADGLRPALQDLVVGRRARQDIAANTRIGLHHLD